eukprot:15483981-Alexandrium_andersonii.AAC.1
MHGTATPVHQSWTAGKKGKATDEAMPVYALAIGYTPMHGAATPNALKLDSAHQGKQPLARLHLYRDA